MPLKDIWVDRVNEVDLVDADDINKIANAVIELEEKVEKISADSPIPIEVSTEAEMTALLESGAVGGVYKYTGTTGTYENGALYVLENNLITFTVDGAEYQAEEGMTWEEWVESDYNVDGFTCNGYIPTYVMGQPRYYIMFTENGAGAFIHKTKTIEEKAYEWGYLGK